MYHRRISQIWKMKRRRTERRTRSGTDLRRRNGTLCSFRGADILPGSLLCEGRFYGAGGGGHGTLPVGTDAAGADCLGRTDRSDNTADIGICQKKSGSTCLSGNPGSDKRGRGIRIINQVDLESYLKGVVPSEMPADAPVEALCAQAVCARTYAVRQIREQRMAEWNADVDDTVSCQVYNNIPEQETSNQAVDATCGMVMLCGGEPIEAYFFFDFLGIYRYG